MKYGYFLYFVPVVKGGSISPGSRISLVPTLGAIGRVVLGLRNLCNLKGNSCPLSFAMGQWWWVYAYGSMALDGDKVQGHLKL